MPLITHWRSKTAYEIGRTPNHIYLRPHLLLQSTIAHYTLWTASPIQPSAGGLLTLVPDASGCVVLHLTGACVSGTLWGATTRAVTVNSSPDGAPVRVFIEFLPGGLFQLTGMSQPSLTDGVFPLADLMPPFFAALVRLLETANQVEQLVEGLDALLLPIMLARVTPPAALSAIATLKQAHGLLTMKALSTTQHYSPRHLSRMLTHYLGICPKQFAQLLRINAAVRQFGSGLPLAYLAQESGFYDQAHFIREFKEVCAVTPGDYRRSMSDFYNEPLKF
ncbi:MAG: AraC family transcriptional regulator, partial [Clostridia bacterium]